MSFLGMGFELTAKDKGLNKAIDDMAGAFDKVFDSMDKSLNSVSKHSEKMALKTGHAIGKVINKYTLIDDQLKLIKGDWIALKNEVGRGVRVIEGNVRRLVTVFEMLGFAIQKSIGFRVISGITKGMFNMTKGVMKASSQINVMLEKIGNRIQQFNVADIASNLRSLTGETGNLSNSLESTMVGMMQSTKPIAATLNLGAKEMKKFASQAAGMAYGMNTSADAVAETMAAIHIANKGAKQALNSLGMSTKDWVKVVQTAGVPMSDYVAMLGDMTSSWQISPEESAKLLDSLVAIGKEAGTGVAPLKHAKEQLDGLGDIFKSLPPHLARTSDEMLSLMKTSAKMSGVFMAMGDTQDAAVSKADAVAKMFAEQDVAIQKMVTIGTDQGSILEQSPLLKYLTRLGMDFDEARSIVATGSRDVVAGMKMLNNVYSRFGTDASPMVQRALSGLGDSLGQGAAGLSYLASNTVQGTEALNRMANMAVKSDGALKQFGKDAYSSGLTLQDSYDRAKESFDTMVRSIARKDVKGLVQKQMQGMKEAGKEFQKMAKDPTWGPWIKAMSQFKQMGIGGLFSSMAEQTGVGAVNAAKFGAQAGTILDTVTQALGEVAPLMHLFGMTGPLGPLLAAGGIGGLLLMGSEERKGILGPFSEMFDGLEKMLSGFWDKFSNKFSDVWDNTVSPKIAKVWDESLVPFLEKMAPRIGQAILDAFKWAWARFWETDVQAAMRGVEKVEKYGVGGLSKSEIEKIGKQTNEALKTEESLAKKQGYLPAMPGMMVMPESFVAPAVESNIKRLKNVQNAISVNSDIVSDKHYGWELGGQTSAEQFLKGVTETLKDNKPKVDDGFGYATEGGLAHSPIKSGPLAGEGMENAAYRGGMQTMDQFALGITDSTDMVREAVNTALDESVILALDTYATKMRELASQKSFLSSVAKSMIKDMGMTIETSVDSEADVNVKKNFEAAMNLPGLASVVLAVSNEGAQTRKLLKKILDESVKHTVLMSIGTGGVGGVLSATPPPA